MKIKTSTLTDIALDWVVSKIEGVPFDTGNKFASAPGVFAAWRRLHAQGDYHYSDDPAVAWPIIKRVGISLLHKTHNGEWHATIHSPREDLHGGLRVCIRWHKDDPLVAAMRCFVASRLGDEVDVPDELCAERREEN